MDFLEDIHGSLISVYDEDGTELGLMGFVLPPPPATTFLGVVRNDGGTIHRIELYKPVPMGPGEGIASIPVDVDAPACPWDCQPAPDESIGIQDLLALLAAWGSGGPCDFDGTGAGITDLLKLLKLLSAWGGCG